MFFLLVVSTVLVLSTVLLGIVYIKKGLSGNNAKTVLGFNILGVFGVLITATVVFLSGEAFAAQEAVAGTAVGANGLKYIAAALSTGLATIGAGIAVAVSSSAALGAISEDSKLLGKTLIFVGLAEGIAIYGMIISILILFQ